MRRDNWLVILILSVLLLLTYCMLCEKRRLVILILSVLQLLNNRYFSLWEKTLVGDTDTLCVTVTYQFSLYSVRRDNWLVILILSMLQLQSSLRSVRKDGWWYWYSLCYSNWPIVTLLCKKRQLVGDTDTHCVTVSVHLLLCSARKDNWLVIRKHSVLQLATNCL